MQTTTSAALRLKKILVAVDFSPPSKQALHHALKLAKFFHADLTLLHVVERIGLGLADESQARLDDASEQVKIARKNLQALSATSSAKTLIRHGLAPHQIVEGAKEIDADLIVLATNGYPRWKRLCVGSTAEAVVRTAPCPVLVVRAGEAERRTKPRRILVPTDFSDCAHGGVDYAFALAEATGSEVVLLNVIAPDDGDGLHDAELRLRILAAGHPAVSSAVRRGDAPNEICRAAIDAKAEMIVMATHGETSWEHFCLGSTAEAVVHAARTPVLVVREKEHELI